MLYELRGRALLRRTTDRAADVDAAIEAFEYALQHSVSGEQAAGVLDNLGSAHAQRPRGDRGENVEHAIAAQRQGLAELEPDSSPEAVAIAQTNLAATMLTREHGDRAENLKEAIELCRAALTYRSPARNGVDWAYTQLNLAGALGDLATVMGDDNTAAIAAFEQVVMHRDQVDEPWLVGEAFASIGRLLLGDTEPDAERQLAAQGEELHDLLDNDQPLERARECLEEARQLVPGAADPTLEGRLLRDLSAVYHALDRPADAISAAEHAVDVLTAVAAPREVVGVASRLGDLKADDADWMGAARAYAHAVRAAEAGLDARLEDRAREDEQRSMPTLHRRAAFALARNDQPEDAALVLEAGRARALRTRLGVDAADPDGLDRLPPDQRDTYRSAAERAAEAPLGPTGAPQRRHLANVLAVIRAIPGFADFAGAPKLPQIVAGASQGSPLMYVNPTPYGTLLLSITADETRQVHAQILERPTGLELYGQLLVGENLDGDVPADGAGPSYLFAITGHGDDPLDLQHAVEHALSWTGEAVARPIAEELARFGARGATLVLCGPLGAVPIGSASWMSGGNERRLTDDLVVNYAPSARSPPLRGDAHRPHLPAGSSRRLATRTTISPPQALRFARSSDASLRIPAPSLSETGRRSDSFAIMHKGLPTCISHVTLPEDCLIETMRCSLWLPRE